MVFEIIKQKGEDRPWLLRYAHISQLVGLSEQRQQQSHNTKTTHRITTALSGQLLLKSQMFNTSESSSASKQSLLDYLLAAVTHCAGDLRLATDGPSARGAHLPDGSPGGTLRPVYLF